MMKKVSVMIVGAALAAIVSFVGAGGCDETQNAFNCTDLCNRYRDCFDHSYDAGACSSRWASSASSPRICSGAGCSSSAYSRASR